VKVSIILGVVKRNPLFFHSISCKNNRFLFTTPNISFDKSGNLSFICSINVKVIFFQKLLMLEILCQWKKKKDKTSLLHVITLRLPKCDERASIISHTETATSISQEGTRYAHQGESRWRKRFQKSTSTRYPNPR